MGYGHAHERLRKVVLVSDPWIGRPCPRCDKPMFPGQRLDMDHLPDEAGRRVRDNVYVPGYLSATPNACRSRLCGAGQRMFAGSLQTRRDGVAVRRRCSHPGSGRLRCHARDRRSPRTRR
jgi:hypothetical protein